MTFVEIIDTILRTNKLGINSVSGIESYCGLSPGSVSKRYKKGTFPGRMVIKTIQDSLGINHDWWESGAGSIYSQNLTSEPKPHKKEGLDYMNVAIQSLLMTVDSMKQDIKRLEQEVKELRLAGNGQKQGRN